MWLDAQMQGLAIQAGQGFADMPDFLLQTIYEAEYSSYGEHEGLGLRDRCGGQRCWRRRPC